MDIVYLTDLKMVTTIGIYPWERQIPQTISMDLELATDISSAAASDDIAVALNYKEVAVKIIALVESSNFKLIETLAETVSQMIMREFHVPWLRLKLSKAGAIRDVSDLGLVIERGSRN